MFKNFIITVLHRTIKIIKSTPTPTPFNSPLPTPVSNISITFLNGVYNSLSWIKDQQWLFIIAGWFVVYLLNERMQKGTRKRNLEIETTFEMLERLKVLSESLYCLTREAELLKSVLKNFELERFIVCEKSKSAMLPNLETILKDFNKAYSQYHFFFKSRQCILSECFESIHSIDNMAYTTKVNIEVVYIELSIFSKPYNYSPDEINEIFSHIEVEKSIKNLEYRIKMFNEDFDAKVGEVFLNLQNIYLSPVVE